MWEWECEGNRQFCLQAVGPGLVYRHKREAWLGTGVLSGGGENLEGKMDRKRNRVHATSGSSRKVRVWLLSPPRHPERGLECTETGVWGGVGVSDQQSGQCRARVASLMKMGHCVRFMKGGAHGPRPQCPQGAKDTSGPHHPFFRGPPELPQLSSLMPNPTCKMRTLQTEVLLHPARLPALL